MVKLMCLHSTEKYRKGSDINRYIPHIVLLVCIACHLFEVECLMSIQCFVLVIVGLLICNNISGLKMEANSTWVYILRAGNGHYVPPKHWCLCRSPQSVTIQKTIIFTSVRTSYLIFVFHYWTNSQILWYSVWEAHGNTLL
jgi:hypothetical protein